MEIFDSEIKGNIIKKVSNMKKTLHCKKIWESLFNELPMFLNKNDSQYNKIYYAYNLI